MHSIEEGPPDSTPVTEEEFNLPCKDDDGAPSDGSEDDGDE